ncbi:heterodisulfide reductase-related iron-sulfur binding cluster [Tahibacter amnicola]|uniref:Glycolate oxidase iron-sulfur subunit n=1 Tax=Tahibacter amnicola TaxID=2976241 RepID=A0ABY6BFS3_9GAMM|nr:heterodisulfide reductase-related iron-sulfur binding cluster [Tahibacter amnicola]UXI68869.1 heterodisulfide reductase-related iron-sulfur binding cluster [Tahibacter amnicola]
MKCGLCLPHCPTYRLARVEAESPRGRIALMQSVAQKQIAPSPALLMHLDQCLGCGSCERVCPSSVAYGRLLRLGRESLRRPPGRAQRMMYALAARPRWLRALAFAARRAGVSRWLPGISARLLGADSSITRAARAFPAARIAQSAPLSAPAPRSRGRVGLFLGCVASAFDQDTHHAARRLLDALGFEVVIPSGQGCCGALAWHAGHADTAAALATPTRQSFVEARLDMVLVSASGCYSTLRELTFAQTAVDVREIGEFLSGQDLSSLAFRPLDATVAVHLPCSLVNAVKAGAAVTTLLSRIPGIRLVTLPEQPRCCGAAGSYFLEHPAQADALLTEKLDQTQALSPDLLVTSNIGCRLHLESGVRQRARALPVLHPITLLARQLDA